MNNQDGGLNCPSLTLTRVNVMLDAKISLVPMHQLIVPSTLLTLATQNNPNTQSHKDTYTQSIDILYELFFQNSSKTDQ